MRRLFDRSFYARNRGAIAGFVFGAVLMQFSALFSAVIFTGNGLSDAGSAPQAVAFIE